MNINFHDFIEAVGKNFDSDNVTRFAKQYIAIRDYSIIENRSYIPISLVINGEEFKVYNSLPVKMLGKNKLMRTALRTASSQMSLLATLERVLKTIPVKINLTDENPAYYYEDNQVQIESWGDVGKISMPLETEIADFKFQSLVFGIPLEKIFSYQTLQQIFEDIPPPPGQHKKREFF